MATTQTSVRRLDDPVGDAFLTFDIPGGEKAQGVVLVNADGAHAGITGFPLTVEGLVTIDSTIPVTVQLAPSTLGTAWEYNTGATGDDSATLVFDGGATKYVLNEFRLILDTAVTADRYVMLFDSATPPADTAVPVWRGVVPEKGMMAETFEAGLEFTNGISFALSVDFNDLLTTTSNEAFLHARGRWT